MYALESEIDGVKLLPAHAVVLDGDSVVATEMLVLM
jgi:hypothetical protein